MKNRHYLYIIVAILALIAGIVFGHYFWPVSKIIVGTQIRADSTEYKFINPLLLVSNTGAGEAPEYKSIAKTLTDYVNQKISEKKATDISIYFRDLNSGLYSGVNESHLYSPASMMKVAVLIVTLQKVAADPSFLDKKIHVDPQSVNFDKNQFYVPQHPIIPGNTYTVKDLITSMTADSDNNAENLLEYLVGDDKIDLLFKELQLPSLVGKDSVDFLSPQQYSRLYRILYNSSYLSPDVSEETLSFLVNNSFPQGLSSGVPKGVDVAQKFGERTLADQLGNVANRELHDCGIVYLPNNPYFICVMTKGQDFKDLQPIISDVSKMVWDYFSSVNK